MTATTIKREVHTPTTDQSEDSGVDVSAAAAAPALFCGVDDGRGTYKRKRPGDRDYADGCPSAVKSSRTDTSRATAAVLSVNVAVVPGEKTAATRVGCGPPFRPWSCSHESSSDVGLRLFHDIRNVDRILTLTQRREAPPEPQPLDLTNGRKRGDVPLQRVAAATAAPTAAYFTTAAAAVTPKLEFAAAAETATADVACCTAAERHPETAARRPTDGVVAAPTPAAAATTSRYSKNMSRARRIEANARERSRVHTISAAFDTLRATVPSYSRNQKLSKLSTIRIASAYILTLSRLLDLDYSAEQDGPSVEECINNVTGIIHMEGKSKKRKDER